MKLFICPNTANQQQLQNARLCIETLTAKFHLECSMSESDASVICPNNPLAGCSPSECDLIVAIGGDGAVLRAAQTAIAANKPLVGINGGRLGYLCAIELSELESLPSDLFARLMPTKRQLLSFEYSGKTHYALNDVVIAKHNLGRTTELEISCGGSKLITWRCDGVIVSTPTGSTAYNLSAGGPILMPDVEATVITPICSHSLISRPLILSSRCPVTVSITSRADNQAYISPDGVLLGEIQGSVTISMAEKHLTLLSKSDSGFSDTVYKISSRGTDNEIFQAK